MDKNGFDSLDRYLILDLTRLWMLSEKLNSFLAKDAEEHSLRIAELARHPLMKEKDLTEEAAKDGYRTLGDLQKLSKKDPQRAQQIMMQSGLRLQHTLLDVDLRLSQYIYPNITVSSMVIMAFAMFERSLLSTCLALAETWSYKLTLSDLAGHSTLDKVQRYLRKVVQVDYRFSKSSSWERIKGHQEIRNLLVHNGGLLDESERSDKVRKFIKHRRISISIEEGSLSIQKDYIKELITDLQQLLTDMFDALKKANKAGA